MTTDWPGFKTTEVADVREAPDESVVVAATDPPMAVVTDPPTVAGIEPPMAVVTDPPTVAVIVPLKAVVTDPPVDAVMEPASETVLAAVRVPVYVLPIVPSTSVATLDVWSVTVAAVLAPVKTSVMVEPSVKAETTVKSFRATVVATVWL